MKSKIKISPVFAIILALGASLPNLAADAQSSLIDLSNAPAGSRSETTQHFLKEPVYGYRETYLGDREMCVTVSRDRGVRYASVWSLVPDSQQYFSITRYC